MHTPIHTETLPKVPTTTLTSLPLLPGEIEGVVTSFLSIPAGSTLPLTLKASTMHLFFVVNGDGTFENGSHKTSWNGMAVWIPTLESAAAIHASSLTQVLVIEWKLLETEMQTIKTDALPYMLEYAKAKTYKEAIKSPKTINRTLVPEDIIPRFCMGSVETEGPDAVGAHRHPMLEQHFYGLPGNCCTVKADDAEALFTEQMLLHIPLGSEHSVRVQEGKKLHYLWIDYFRDAAGVEWIKKMHKSDDA